jgi:HAD superfamily hydrolase (TIGR01509 family)
MPAPITLVRSIVFDMDGTLVDSPLCFTTIKQALGIPESSYILEHLAVIDPEQSRAKHRQLEDFEVSAARQAVLMPGVAEMFRRLKERQILTGIFTRNCRAATDTVLEKYQLPVDAVITREDAAPKPDPEGLLQLLTRWKLRPEDMLYVGDYRFDIECGKRAGVRTVLYTAGTLPADDYNADFVVSHYDGFPEGFV